MGQRRQRRTNDVGCASCLQKQPLQIGEDRRLPVRLDVDLPALDLPRDETGPQKGSQFTLHRALRGPCLANKLTQVESFVGVPVEPGEQLATGLSEQNRASVGGVGPPGCRTHLAHDCARFGYGSQAVPKWSGAGISRGTRHVTVVNGAASCRGSSADNLRLACQPKLAEQRLASCASERSAWLASRSSLRNASLRTGSERRAMACQPKLAEEVGSIRRRAKADGSPTVAGRPPSFGCARDDVLAELRRTAFAGLPAEARRGGGIDPQASEG